MIEQDSIGSEHIVGFSIIYNNPESIHFGCPCWQRIRVELEYKLPYLPVYDWNFVSKQIGTVSSYNMIALLLDVENTADESNR